MGTWRAISARCADANSSTVALPGEWPNLINKSTAIAPAPLTMLQPSDNLVVNAMDLGGEVLVGQLRSTVAGDAIAIGSVA
jgi:hypothetical protein